MSIKDVANNIAKTVIDSANKGVANYINSRLIEQTSSTNSKSLNIPFFKNKGTSKQLPEKTVVTTDTYTKVMTLLNAWFIKYPVIILCTYIIIQMIIAYAKSVIEMIV